ncbi:hypothetical protein QHH11_19860, partial [Aphanizomenon sp. PH219]|nr:hypothetical protein [Aphanizomenon sp. PH219]
ELLAAALVPSGTLRERYRTPNIPKQRTACSSASSLRDAPRTLSHPPHPKSELLAAALVPSGTLRERYRTPNIPKSELLAAVLRYRIPHILKQRTACSSASLSHSHIPKSDRTSPHSPTSDRTPHITKSDRIPTPPKSDHIPSSQNSDS